jgi:hypothetical protein
LHDALGTVTAEEFLALDDADATELIAARFRVLRDLGCNAESAVLLAVHPEVGVTEASDLIRRGCDPPTALRILL